MNFYQQLRDYDAIDSIESSTKEAVLRFIEAHRAASFGREITGDIGHLTSAAWILNREATKVLLVFGAKMGRWKLPSEHVESEAEIEKVARGQVARALGSESLGSAGSIFALVEVEIPEYWNTPAHHHFEVVWHFMADEKEELPRGAKWFALDEVALLGDEALTRLVEKTKLRP